ncbi:hypothetical protein ACI78T_02910 [Blastococcus sp. SYSU D00922]
MRTWVVGLAVVVAGLCGCSSYGDTATTAATTGDQPSATPDLCRSADALRTSLTGLSAGRVVSEGTDALAEQWSVVQDYWAQLADDARSSYSEEVDGVQADADAVQSAVTAATGDPSAATLATVASTLEAFLQGAGAFLDEVGSTC